MPETCRITVFHLIIENIFLICSGIRGKSTGLYDRSNRSKFRNVCIQTHVTITASVSLVCRKLQIIAELHMPGIQNPFVKLFECFFGFIIWFAQDAQIISKTWCQY